MLRSDLKAAGVPYKTSEGVADFHSSRVTYISNIVSSGASVKTCQTLARHADPALTIGIYAKASLHDISGAVEALPDLTASEPVVAVARATGTDDCVVSQESATGDATSGSLETRKVLSINSLGEKKGGILNARGTRYDPCSSRTE
jgi:hypothetical protein